MFTQLCKSEQFAKKKMKKKKKVKTREVKQVDKDQMQLVKARHWGHRILVPVGSWVSQDYSKVWY